MISVAKGSIVTFEWVIPSDATSPQTSYYYDQELGKANSVVLQDSPGGVCKVHWQFQRTNNHIDWADSSNNSDGIIRISLPMDIAGINVISFAHSINENDLVCTVDNNFLEISPVKVRVIDTVDLITTQLTNNQIGAPQ